ncbi:MAG: hypothetical protein JW816_02965, partial [Candidatus Buchananbacteria bacterium]|nr:hypothetical protein [Candidatus Buchananbacteria bacterium]
QYMRFARCTSLSHILLRFTPQNIAYTETLCEIFLLKFNYISKDIDKKEIINYFRANIYEALVSFNAWQILFFSKSKDMVSEELAKQYVEIQNYHKNFFVAAERAFLVNAIMLLCHSFDNRDDSLSLYKINNDKTKLFVSKNKAIIKKLKNLRSKIFAHRDVKAEKDNIIPPATEIDDFFKNLISFYNELSKNVDNSSTYFNHANDIKKDTDNLLMNVYRGETIRKTEVDIKWKWQENNKKISGII